MEYKDGKNISIKSIFGISLPWNINIFQNIIIPLYFQLKVPHMLVPGTKFSIYAGSIEIDALETLMHLQSFNKLVSASFQINFRSKQN